MIWGPIDSQNPLHGIFDYHQMVFALSRESCNDDWKFIAVQPAVTVDEHQNMLLRALDNAVLCDTISFQACLARRRVSGGRYQKALHLLQLLPFSRTSAQGKH